MNDPVAVALKGRAKRAFLFKKSLPRLFWDSKNMGCPLCTFLVIFLKESYIHSVTGVKHLEKSDEFTTQCDRAGFYKIGGNWAAQSGKSLRVAVEAEVLWLSV